MTLRERNKARTREVLVEAALTLFAKFGFESTTVDQIAEEAKVSRRTFFRYFPTKEAVVFPERERRLAEFRAMLTGHHNGSAPFETLRKAFLVLADDYTANRERVMLQQRVVEDSPTLLAYDFELDRHWEGAVAEALGDCPRTGAKQRRRARLEAGALMGAVRATLQEWYASGGRLSLRTLGQQAFDLMNHGLAAEHEPEGT
ncbi:MAG: TetR family transcriptional regulator [bacterium]